MLEGPLCQAPGSPVPEGGYCRVVRRAEGLARCDELHGERTRRPHGKETLPEMNTISRFFVNLSASRRAAGEYRWIRQEVAIPTSARCLELGCGNGHFATRFVGAFRPIEYVATDIDPVQVEAARRTIERRNGADATPNLTVRAADMLRLPFPDSSFEVVLAFVTIHHSGHSHHDFSQVPQALSEIDRVLRPSGLLVYQEFLHQDAIRRWLTEHAFTLEQVRRRWRLESVAARKSGIPV